MTINNPITAIKNMAVAYSKGLLESNDNLDKAISSSLLKIFIFKKIYGIKATPAAANVP